MPSFTHSRPALSLGLRLSPPSEGGVLICFTTSSGCHAQSVLRDVRYECAAGPETGRMFPKVLTGQHCQPNHRLNEFQRSHSTLAHTL